MGFRECGVADADKLTEWLISNVTQVERRDEQVREEFLARCLAELLVERVVGRLSPVVRSRLLELVSSMYEAGELRAEGGSLFSIRPEPANVSLNTMLAEVAKLEAARAAGLPTDLFADVAPKILAGWRARAAAESPSHLREHPPEMTLTLLAALLHRRQRKIRHPDRAADRHGAPDLRSGRGTGDQ